jgi:multiple sugar transport system ATP-binding protein
VFLFDEPLSNLDAALRSQMRVELAKLHQDVKTTMIYVTHDQVEAMTLADRVVVMNQGRIEQIGTPNDLYHTPKTKFVAGFIGSPAMNFIPCRLDGDSSALSVRLDDAVSFPVPEDRAARYRPHLGKELLFGLRPEHITEPRGYANGRCKDFAAAVDVIEPMGMETMVFFQMNRTEVCARVDPSCEAKPGASVRLSADLGKMHLIDPKTDQVL